MDAVIVTGLVAALLGFLVGRTGMSEDMVCKKRAGVAVLNAYLKGIDFAMSAVDKFGAEAVDALKEEYRAASRAKLAVERNLVR